MKNSQNTITLNGNIYDAKTGLPIKGQRKASALVTKTKPHKVTPKPSIKNINSIPVVRETKHLKHHQPQKTKTLMNRVTKKPNKSTIQPTSTIIPITSRHRRAISITKSSLISRFGSNAYGVTKKSAHIPVKTASVTPIVNHKPLHYSLDPLRETAHEVRDIFTDAIANANNFQQSPISKTRSKKNYKHIIRAGSSTLVVVFLIGFIFLQNKTNLEVMIASNRAGVSGVIPKYIPSNYKYDFLEYSPGIISITFTSTNNLKTFNVSHKKSNWNSETLYSNLVASKANNSNYIQNITNQDRTIYIDNNNNASWISHNSIYQIEGNSDLTKDQILKIASSI